MRAKGVIVFVGLVCIALDVIAGESGAAEKANADYLSIVKNYADALIEKGRDDYGSTHSPLFATTLDRKTMRLFEGKALDELWQMRLKDWANWRVRNRDRSLRGANPMHDENLYQVLYALTKITGEKHYGEEADKTLRWFFENCQSAVTGLMAWGEHISWDFRTEGLSKWKKGYHHGGKMQEYNTHEFARPWVLWEHSFELAPEACAKFGRGLWLHQIGDHNTGNFSRHANYERHQTFTNSEYPRHGGFYMATWAQCYKETKDALFVKAIDTLVTYFDGRRSKVSDGVPAESAARSGGKALWSTSNLSLAIDLWNGSSKVPKELGAKMRGSASRTDEVFLKLGHDIGRDGRGFVLNANVDTLVPAEQGGYSDAWGHAGPACLCLIRYKQVKLQGYRKLIIQTADYYVDSEPEIKFAVHPRSLGGIIYLLVGTYELTGEQKYLERADYFAKRSVELFMDGTSPLPKATSKHNQYEAVTGSDTLMMSLLRLWAVKHRPGLDLSLVYCDR